MDPDRIKSRTLELFRGGRNCAEAVAIALLEAYPNCCFAPRLATAFGGGIGKTHEEACGALTGGVLALGALFGRDAPGADWQGVADKAALFRQAFLADNGALRCADLVQKFGEAPGGEACQAATARAAFRLAEIINHDGD